MEPDFDSFEGEVLRGVHCSQVSYYLYGLANELRLGVVSSMNETQTHSESSDGCIQKQLWRLRHEDPTQYHTLVKMHLSFATDLPTDQWVCCFPLCVTSDHAEFFPPFFLIHSTFIFFATLLSCFLFWVLSPIPLSFRIFFAFVYIFFYSLLICFTSWVFFPTLRHFCLLTY